jgi:hypothetical protein
MTKNIDDSPFMSIDELEDEFMILDTNTPDEDLAAVCFKITEWWLEDYSFDDLLEEFDVLPEEAFYAIVKSGLIDPDDLEAYLTSDR